MAITVEFSPSVAEAVGKFAEKQRERMERNFNIGLKQLADGNGEWSESARGLYESKQTIRIVCHTGEEGREILERHNHELPQGPSALAGAGPALTYGDFNEDGSPRKGGTAIIVIDNDIASEATLEKPEINFLGQSVSYYQILIHELLHASHKTRIHKKNADGTDNIAEYERWVKDFLEIVIQAKHGEFRKGRRRRDWKIGALPDLFRNPVVVMASLVVGVVGCLMLVYFFRVSNLYQLIFPVSEPAQETPEVQAVQVVQEPDAMVLTDITFSQVDFYLADGSIGLADSLFGNMSWSYVPDPTTTYYLSVSAALSADDEPGWVIQNLPLFPAMDGDGAVHREGTFFNLGGLGLTAGTDLSEIYYSWTVNDFIVTTGPGTPDTYAEVQTAAHHFCLQGDPVEIDSDFEYFYPEEIHIFGIPLRKNSPRKVSAVQEDSKTCMAGAFARGISWLDQEYGLNFHTTAQDIYEGLRFWGVSDHALEVEDWIAGARDYTQHQTGNLIEFAAWEQGDLFDPVDGVPETSVPLIEWLGNAFETGVVGLAYAHSQGGHIVTAYDMYTIAGTTFIMYRDDGAQGHYLGDQFVKHSKVYEKDGNYYLGSDGKRITYAIAMLPAPSLVGSIVDYLQPYPPAVAPPVSDEEKTWGIFASLLSGSFTHYQGYSEVHGNVVVFGKDPEPIPNATVTLTMTRNGGSPETLSAVTNQDGEAHVTFTIHSYGTYSVSLNNIEAENMVYTPEWNAADSVEVKVVSGESTPIFGFDRLQAFYENFNNAYKTEDVDFLYKHLHPTVIDLYGADVCRSYLETMIASKIEVRVDKVTDFGMWDWEIDGTSTPIENAYALRIIITLPDGQSGYKDTHLALLDDVSLAWFTQCAEALP